MTSGSAPPADGPQDGSSTTLTDGPSSAPPTTVPIEIGYLADLLQQMFLQGWQSAMNPILQSLYGGEGPSVRFQVEVLPDDRRLNVELILD